MFERCVARGVFPSVGTFADEIARRVIVADPDFFGGATVGFCATQSGGCAPYDLCVMAAHGRA